MVIPFAPGEPTISGTGGFLPHPPVGNPGEVIPERSPPREEVHGDCGCHKYPWGVFAQGAMAGALAAMLWRSM